MNEHFITQSVNEQQRLLDAIWNHELSSEIGRDFDIQDFDIKGINIYRRNLLANAQRALSISFPTVFELLDSDVSASLLQLFLKTSPPTQGDWAQWGREFPEFIAATAVGRDYPYLADNATLDWHIHNALQGKDQTLDQSTLQLLADREPENIYIELNVNVQLIKTRYPTSEIFHAHHDEDEIQRDIALENAQQALTKITVDNSVVEHFIMVYRPEFQPCVTKLTDCEGLFMLALISGKSLAESLNVVNKDTGFSFETWLIAAIKNNLIHYFKES